MKTSAPPSRPAVRGFTLLELMTAIAVAGILLGIGVPAFTSIVRGNQIAAESNNLLSALMLARSEAITRGVRVSVCAAATPTTCTGTTDWNNGWIVFEDDFGSAGVLDASDVVLQSSQTQGSGVAISADVAAVTFTRSGRAELAGTFGLTKTGCTAEQQRRIDVGMSGRVGSGQVNCSVVVVAEEEEEEEEA